MLKAGDQSPCHKENGGILIEGDPGGLISGFNEFTRKAVVYCNICQMAFRECPRCKQPMRKPMKSVKWLCVLCREIYAEEASFI